MQTARRPRIVSTLARISTEETRANALVANPLLNDPSFPKVFSACGVFAICSRWGKSVCKWRCAFSGSRRIGKRRYGSCTESDGRGSGGTGHDDGSGTGGTGHGDGNGSGGTGIEGFITGFGSVCVNGLEVEYQESALPPGLDHLAVGQRVQIDAIEHGNTLVAREIRVKYVVVGPVQHVNPAPATSKFWASR